MSPLIAFVILTKNEELNLPRCIGSLEGLDADVFVVDSGSTDRTVQVAAQLGATVLSNSWKNYSTQMNWALDNMSTGAAWVFRLDADEYLTPELNAELRQVLPTVRAGTAGFAVKRRIYFLGKWIRHGGMYPISHVRLWRRGQARCEDRWMDEHMEVTGGTVDRLGHDFVDQNNKDLTFWIDKHNWYSNRELLDLAQMEANQTGSHAKLAGQAASKRWAKEFLFAPCPRFVRAFAYWVLRYIFLAGFLDGEEGLIFHFLQAFWYRFLVDAKMFERDYRERLAV